MTNEAWARPVSESEERALAERVAALSDHPGLLAWYMADEPELRPALPERCRKLREICAAADPYHPCIMLNDTIEGIHKYADGGDILMPDPYPLFMKGGLAAQPIEKVSTFMKACQEVIRPGKAIWVTPQAFNYGDYGRKNQRCPNLTELRNMLYQAVIYGAQGFLWYTYSQVGNYPELNIGMPFLAREAQALKPFILSLYDSLPVKVGAPKTEHVHASLRRVGKDWVLFVVNTATESQSVELSLPADIGGEAFVISEGRRVKIEQNRLREEFAPYATHLFTNSPKLSQPDKLLADVEGAISRANAARKKPGNLAFEDSGVEVEVSSKSTFGSTPDRVVDGITSNMMWRDGTPRKFPDWLSLTWPSPQRIGRVVVYSPSLCDYQVQILDESREWRTVGALNDVKEEMSEVRFPVVETKAIRIFVTKVRDSDFSQIWEVEAYEH